MDPIILLLSLVFEGAMVGVFVTYALRRDRRESAERSGRDKQWQTFIEGITVTFRQALEDRDSAMAEALRTDREQRKSDTVDRRGSIAELTGAVSGLTSAISRHEALAEKRHQRTLDAIQSNGKARRR